ncbi:hypothetical protein GCM10023094_45360 [Rhodococcus olei]|uniref:Uncharacterized protein n=1 Tax=Rhodococcus olei TaxID=2161675 RepID=A0ABP8PJZ1_9NOCA
MTRTEMTRTDQERRTTLRTAVFRGESDSVLTDRMRPHVREPGMACTRMPRTRAVPRSAFHLLDSRILATALRFLDQDPDPLLLAGLRRYRALVTAARETLAAPGREVVVTLVEPYRVTSEHHPEVTVLVDGNPLGSVTFDLCVTFRMGETAVAVRRGAIEAVDCVAGALKVELSLSGGESLLHGSTAFPVRRTLRPPVAIPLPPGR